MLEPNSSLRQLGRFSEPGLLILVSLADGSKHGYAILEDIQQLAGNSSRAGHAVRRARPARAHGPDRSAGARRAPPSVPSDGGGRDGAPHGAYELARPGRDRVASAAGAGVKWLLWLYPRRWRRRYGEEFLAVLQERGLSVMMLLDVLRSALDAWLHPELVAVPAPVGGSATRARRRDRFDKFTRRSRTVLDLAAKEAQRLGHPHITSEHLLLGMLLEGEGVAAHVLAERGVHLDELRKVLLEGLESVPRNDQQRIGLSDDAKRAIELSVAEANRLRHHYVGTEHLLLGLVQVTEEHGTAAQILRQCNAGDLAELRSHVVRVLNEGGPHLRRPV
jgi:hypothetical protein